MNRVALWWLAVVAISATGCSIDPTLLHTTEEYGKMRGVEVLTREPSRPYEVLITTKGTGGDYTATRTMINAMVDDAKKAGADALIPLAGAADRPNATGLDVFVYTDAGRTVTWGRAVKWKNGR